MPLVQFNEWCITANAVVGDHNLSLLTGEIDKLETGIGKRRQWCPVTMQLKNRFLVL